MGYEQVLGQISEQQQKIREEQQKAQQEKQKAQEHIKKLEEKAPIPERIQKKELARTSPAYRVKRQQQIKKAKKAKEELKEYQKELTGYEEELGEYEKELEEQEGTVKEYKEKGYEIEETPEGYQFIKRTTRKVSKKVTPKTAPITIGSQPKQRYTIPQLQKIKKLFQVAKSRVSGPLQRVYDKYIALADEKIAELKKRPTVITRLEETIDKIDQPQIKQALERVKTQLERQYESKLESIVTSTSPMVIDTYYTYKKKHPGATMPDYAKYTAEHMRFIKSLDPSVLEDVQQKRQIRKQTIQDLQKINITPSTYTPDIQLTLGDQAIRAESYEDLVSGLVERQQTQIQKALTQQKQTVISDYRKTGSIPNWFASEVEVPEVYQSLGLEDKYKQAAFEQVYGISKAPEGFVGPTQPPLVQFQQTEVEQALKTATPAQTSKYLETLKKEGQFKDPTTGKIATFQELKEKGIKDLKLVDGQLVFVPMTEVELGKKKYDTLVQSYRDAGYSKDEAFRLVNTQLATVGMMTLGVSDISNAFGSEVEKDEMEQYLRGVDKGFWDTPEEFVQQRYGWGKKVQREAIQRLKDNLENPPVGMDKALYTLALKDEAFRTAAEKLPEEIKKRTLAEHALSAISPLYNIASTSYGRQVLGSEAMVHGVYIPAITMGIGTVASAATKVGTEALAHVAPKLAKAVGYALPAGLIGYGGYESGKVIWEAYQPGKVTLQTPSGEFYEKELGGAGAALERAAPIALAWASAGEGAKLTQKYSPQLSRAGQRIAQKGTQAYWRAQSLFSKATPRTYQTLASIRPKMSRMIQAKTVEREGGLFRPEELTDIYQDWQTSDYVWPEQHPLYQKKFPMEYAPTRPWERVDIMPTGAGKGTGISLAGRTQYGTMSDYAMPDQPIGKPSQRISRKEYIRRLKTLNLAGEAIEQGAYPPIASPRKTTLSLRGKTFKLQDVSADVLKRGKLNILYNIDKVTYPYPEYIGTDSFSFVGKGKNWLKGLDNFYTKNYYREVLGLNRRAGNRMSYEAMRALYGKQGVQDITEPSFLPSKMKKPFSYQSETDVLKLIKQPKQIVTISDKTGKNVKFITEKDITTKPKIEGIDTSGKTQKTIQVMESTKKQLDVNAYLKQEAVKTTSPEEYMYNHTEYIPEIWRQEFITKIRYAKTLSKKDQKNMKKKIIAELKERIYSPIEKGEFDTQYNDGVLGFYHPGEKEIVVSSKLPKTKLEKVLRKIFKLEDIEKNILTKKEVARHEAVHYKRYKQGIPIYKIKTPTYGEVEKEEEIVESIRKTKKPFKKVRKYNIVKKETGFMFAPKEMEVQYPLPSVKRAKKYKKEKSFRTIQEKKDELLSKQTRLYAQLMKGEITRAEYERRKSVIQRQLNKLNEGKEKLERSLLRQELLPPHVDQDAEYIKKIQETWTSEQLQKAIKTGKIDKKLVRKIPVLMEYWNPAEGKLIRVVLKKSLPEHKKTLEKIKETVAEYPQALEKWKFEAWEKQHVKPTARVKSIFEPKRAAFYKPHIDAYKDLRSKETYEKAKKLTDEERKKRIEEKEKELVYPEMSYIAEYEIYGKKYRATDKQAAKKLEKLKEYEQKTIQQRQDAERKIYQGLTKEQELQRRQLNYDAARKERQVKQELNELVKERKIERQAVAVEEWGSLSYKPMENYWKKEEISTMKIEKEKQKGTSLEEMERKYAYKPISIKQKPKPKLEELESKDDLLSGGYMQVQRLKKKQKLETTYSPEEILQGQKMSEQIKQRQKELERTQERIWKESEIKRKQQALIKKAQEVKDKLSKSTTTFQEQRKLQTLLQYLNLVIRKLGDTEGLKKLTDEELGAVIVQAENLEKDIKAGQGEKNVSVIRQAQGLRSKLAQIQRQQQKMLQLQSAAEELIKKTIQRLISGQVIGVISPIQKQRMAVILRPKLEQEILPIYKEVPDYMYTAETPPVRPVTPILLGATEEGPEKERKKRKPLRLEKGYEKRKYEVPNIWKAGGKRPSWAQRPIKKPSIIKKPKTFTITGAKA